MSTRRFLFGAAQIAQFLFENSDANHQQRVFYLVSHSDVPVRKAGNRLMAYTDDLIAWVRVGAGKKAEPQAQPAPRQKRREVARNAARARWAAAGKDKRAEPTEPRTAE